MADNNNKGTGDGNKDGKKEEAKPFNFNFNFGSTGTAGATPGATPGATAGLVGSGSTNTNSAPIKFDFGAASSNAPKTDAGANPFKFDFGATKSGSNTKFDFGVTSGDAEQLDSMVGKPSGYLETLPIEVQNRVKALQELNKETDELDKKLEEEIRAVELKYHELSKVFYLKRKAIVNGEVEPEVPASQTTSTQPAASTPAPDANKEKVKGIPEFWLTALKNYHLYEEAITPDDEEVLKLLTDITFDPVADGNGSFRLDFHFAENPFFTNTVLTKTYHMEDKHGESYCENIESSTIDWKKGKDLTKKLKGDLGEGGSFFKFFTPPSLPDNEDEADEDDVKKMENDFEMASLLKDSLISKAVEWFTGDILASDDFANLMSQLGGDDDEGEDDDYDDDEDNDGDYAPKRIKGAGGKKQPPADCKQQ